VTNQLSCDKYYDDVETNQLPCAKY